MQKQFEIYPNATKKSDIMQRSFLAINSMNSSLIDKSSDLIKFPKCIVGDYKNNYFKFKQGNNKSTTNKSN